MDIFSFLLGLFLLYKGQFRLGRRQIPKDKSRQIALLLMLPMIIGIVAAFMFLPSATGTLDATAAGSLTEGSLNATALEGALGMLLVVSVITFGGVLTAIAYIIYSIPPGDMTDTLAGASRTNVTQPPRSYWTQPTAAPHDEIDPFREESLATPPAAQTPSTPVQPPVAPVQQPRPQQQRLHPLEGGGFAPAGYKPGRPQPKTPPGQPKTIMTLPEVAAYLKLTEAQVESLIDQGRMGAVKSGGQYRVAKLAADDYLEAEATKTTL